MAKLIGIGVGPGDKELLTIKAARIIGESEVIVTPSGMKGGKSIALETVEDYINEGCEVLVKHFPMGGPEQEDKIYEAFEAIEEKLLAGKDVTFLTIGDPFVYSTYIYLLKYIEEKGYETETVPGITSFCACASIAGTPLVIGNEPLKIVPGDRIDTVTDEKFVVVMKVYRREEEVLNYLEDKGFKYVYIKKAGRDGQEVLTNKEEIIKNNEYMALIIANRD